MMLALYFVGYSKEILILIGIILIHELSHGLAAMTSGTKIQEIKLLPIGGVVKLDNTMGFTLGEEIFVSAAGPMSNVVLSAAVFFLQENYGWKSSGLDFIIIGSLFIGAFNLIPALPLDGGKILRCILAYFISYKSATKLVSVFSRIIGVLLIMFNIYLFSLGSYNFTFILVGIFIFYQTKKEYEMATYVTMKDIVEKKESLNKSGSMDSQHITVLPQTSLKDIFAQFTPKKFHIIYVLDERYALKGIVTEDQVLNAIISDGMNAKVKNILEKR